MKRVPSVRLTANGSDRMLIREVLLFAEALRDYYREMAALADGGIVPAEIVRSVGELPDQHPDDPAAT